MLHPAIPPGQYQETTTENNGKKTISRTIGDDGHPIITQEMFIENAKARLEAAKVLNQEHKKKSDEQKNKDLESIITLETKVAAFFNDDTEGKKLEDAFKEAKKNQIEVINQIKVLLDKAQSHRGDLSDADFESIVKQTQLMRANAEKEYQQAFDSLYDHNIKKLNQVNRLLAHYVDANKKPASVLKTIDKKAALLVAKQVRPDQHNTYRVEGMTVTSSHIPEGELTSSQKDLHQEIFGEPAPTNQLYTNPSTIRDHHQVGQANALRTEVKVNNKTVFTGHRHGSPSVLKIEDEAERQYRTMQNVRQTMAIAAKEKLAKIEKEDPKLYADIMAGKATLPLSMATMSLLSPVADDNPLITKKIDDPMKQYRQVNDSRLAYWSLHGRDVDLEIPGLPKNIKVNLNSTFMNVGVNAARGIGTLEAQALVQRINNRGVNHFIDNFLSNLKYSDNKDTNDVLRKFWAIETDEKITKYAEKIKEFDKSKLQAAYKTLESSNETIHFGNSDLMKLKAELAASTDPESKKEIEREIKITTSSIKQAKEDRKAAKRTIERQESKLDGHYKNLAIARKKAYNKALPALQKTLNEIQGTPIHENLKTDANFQKIRLFVDSLDTFYNQPQPGLKRLLKQKSATKKKNKLSKQLEKEQQKDPINPEKCAQLAEQIKDVQQGIDNLNKGNYRFQARFALLSQHMDNFVEWFCKSGEDRTGLLNEHIEAFCIFIEKHGYAPRWDNEEDSKKFHEIMPHVHNGGPNRETNGFNDKSPGVKVTDTDFEMPSVSYYTDKKIANISKKSGITSKFKELFSKKDIDKKREEAEHALGMIEVEPKFAKRAQALQDNINKFLDNFVKEYKKQLERPVSQAGASGGTRSHMLRELGTYEKDRDPVIQEKAKEIRKAVDQLHRTPQSRQSFLPLANEEMHKKLSPSVETQKQKVDEETRPRSDSEFKP